MAFIDTTDLDEAYSLVLPFVPGAPDQTVLHWLQEKAIEFCARTLVWQSEAAPVLTVADRAAYDIPVPDDAALVKVLSWQLDGRGQWVTPAFGRQMVARGADGDIAWTEDKATFQVHPVPAEAGKAMVISAAYKPTREATEIPTFIYEQHIRAIADGAIGVISAMRQPWRDMEQAALFEGKFERAVVKAAAAISRGNGRTRDRRVVGTFY